MEQPVVTVIIASRSGLLRDGIAGILSQYSGRILSHHACFTFNIAASVTSMLQLMNACAHSHAELALIADDLVRDTDVGIGGLIAGINETNPGQRVLLLLNPVRCCDFDPGPGASPGRHLPGRTLVSSTDISGSTLCDLIASVMGIEHVKALTAETTATSIRTPPEPGAPHITSRENEILKCVSCGLSNKEIAGRLGIQLQTVKNHISRLLEKLNLEDRVQLAMYEAQSRYVSQP